MNRTALVLSLLCLCGPAAAAPAADLNAELARIATVMNRNINDWRPQQEIWWPTTSADGEFNRVPIAGYRLKSPPFRNEMHMYRLQMQLETFFNQPGWTLNSSSVADGPDSFAMGYQKQRVVCLMEGQWPRNKRSGKITVSCARWPQQP